MILQILVGGAVIGVAAGLIQTFRVERRPSQEVFRGGKVPKPLPDGFHRGTTTVTRGKNWRGKVFDRGAQTGINRFADGERYPFKMYAAPGLRDRDLRVLRIDYNVPGNPWWLRLVTDELVQTQPGHYLGKVHLALLPGLTFTAAYFELYTETTQTEVA